MVRAPVFDTEELSQKLFAILLPGTAVLIGGLLYILFRPAEPLFLGWISTLGMERQLEWVRNISLPLVALLPVWFIYSLPNGLWAFAYTVIIVRKWSCNSSYLRLFWLATIPVLVLGFEVLQLTSVVGGTFCFLDLAFGMAGIFSGCILIQRIKILQPINHLSNNEKAQ